MQLLRAAPQLAERLGTIRIHREGVLLNDVARGNVPGGRDQERANGRVRSAAKQAVVRRHVKKPELCSRVVRDPADACSCRERLRCREDEVLMATADRESELGEGRGGPVEGTVRGWRTRESYAVLPYLRRWGATGCSQGDHGSDEHETAHAFLRNSNVSGAYSLST